MSCRICFDKDISISKLISPCKCKGSSKFVHIHCLNTWQSHCLNTWQNTKKAYVCSICMSTFSHPNRISMLKSRIRHAIIYYYSLFLAITSLTWISFIIVPLKLFLHGLLIILSVVLPGGQISIGGIQFAWIGVFPPRVAIQRTGEPIREIYGGGCVIVASRAIPPSSIFFRSVIILLEHGEAGSKGIIINIDSDALGPQYRGLDNDYMNERDELSIIGMGGPLDTSQYSVFHDSIECSNYSERLLPKNINNTRIRNIIANPLTIRNNNNNNNNNNNDLNQSKSIYYAEYIGAISVCQDITSIIRTQRKKIKENSITKSLSSSILSYIGGSLNNQTDQDSKVEITRVRISRGHARWKPRQLDGEIRAGSWYVIPLKREIIFSNPNDRRFLWNNIISQIENDSNNRIH